MEANAAPQYSSGPEESAVCSPDTTGTCCGRASSGDHIVSPRTVAGTTSTTFASRTIPQAPITVTGTVPVERSNL